MTLISLIIIVLVFARETRKLGQQKTQEIVLTDQSHFTYNASEVLTMNGVNYFYVDQLLPRIREFQLKDKKSTYSGK